MKTRSRRSGDLIEANSDKQPLIYVAGPYQKPDPVVNTRRAIQAGMELYDSGLVVPLIPHLSLLAHLVDPRPVEMWYALDLRQLEHCDALLRLPGESTGADVEVDHAGQIGIPSFMSTPAVIAWAQRGRSG
jgi:hypothetical protein